MKHSISSLLALVFTFAPHAWAQSPAPSAGDWGVDSINLGFYEINSEKIPAEVQKVADSIFQIAIPAGDLVTVKNFFEDVASLDEAIAFCKARVPSPELSQTDLDVILAQLNECKKNNLGLECKIFDSISLSSAYAVGDGRTVRTAFHALEAYARAFPGLVEGKFNRTTIPAILISSKGKRVSGPSQTFIPIARFLNSNFIDVQATDGKIVFPHMDLVEIEFDRNLGPPLKTATYPILKDEWVFQLGFPGPSLGRKEFNRPDSPGNKLRVAKGRVLSVDEVFNRSGQSVGDMSVDQKKLFSQVMISSDADGVKGLSGGAIMNSRGELLGTFTSSYPLGRKADRNHISFGSNDFYKSLTQEE